MNEPKFEDFKFELQFLHHHKDIYLKECADFAATECSPRSKASLESFKSLLLHEAVILLGWDVEWRPSSQQDSGAALGSATLADDVLPDATSGDDNTSSDADKAPGLDGPPVFCQAGQEPLLRFLKFLLLLILRLDLMILVPKTATTTLSLRAVCG